MELFKPKKFENVTILRLFILLLLQLLRYGKPGCALFAQDIFSTFPFSKEFQQIVFITDSSSLKDATDSLFLRNDNAPILALIEVLGERNNISLDVFRYFDKDLRTVVFIWAQNITKFTQILDSILNARYNEDSGPKNWNWKHAQWNPQYFFVWPSTNNDSSHSTTTLQSSQFLKYLHTFSCHLPLNSDVFWIKENSTINTNRTNVNASIHTIWETYSVKDECFVQTVPLSVEQPYFLSYLNKYKWKRRGDFHGALITATAVADPIYAEEARFKQNADGSIELDAGMAVNIFRTFRQHLNFTEKGIIGAYMLTVPSDPSYEGMELLLANGKADISITENAMTYDKAEVVQLLHASTANWLEARFADPPNSKWKFFFTPFSKYVWVTIAIYSVLIIICIGFCRWMSERNGLNVDDDIDEQNEIYSYFHSFQLDFLWALGTLCQQGWYEWPKYTPIKILFLVASTTGFLLFAAYSGTMTSKLSVQYPMTVTFEKLLNKSYSFYMENDFSFPVDISHRPHIRIHTLSTLDDAGSAVVNISKSKSAFISYPEFFFAATRHINMTSAETCSSFTTVKTSSTPNLCSMAVRKLSPFKEVFNVKTLFLWERGILKRIVGDYMATTQLRCVQVSNSLQPQTFSDLFIAYAFIGFGTMIAISLLAIEFSINLTYKFLYSDLYYTNTNFS